MKELLSVIIPVHNVEEFLKQCIESVINQTYRELDIILIDDGSVDRSLEICKKFAELDQRIRYVHFSESGGAVRARQKGVELAYGNYVAYVDADDWMELDAFEKMMNSILETNADIVMSTGRFHEFADVQHIIMDDAEEGIYIGDEIDILVTKMLSEGPDLWPTLINRIYKKDMHRQIQALVDGRIKVNNDVACTTMTVLNANKVVVIKQCFYHYRRNEHSITNSWRSDYIESKWYMYQCIKQEMIKNGKDHLINILNIHILNKFLKDIRIECSRLNTKGALWKIKRLKQLYSVEIIAEFMDEFGTMTLEGENAQIWKIFKKKNAVCLYLYIKWNGVKQLFVDAG